MANVKLSNVIRRAQTKVDKDDTDLVFYVGGEHIESENIRVHSRGIIAESTIGPMFYYGFKAGDFLLVSRNPHLKKAGLVDFDGICSEKTFVLETANSDVLLPEFLPFVLQNERFWDYAYRHRHGSTNTFINWSTLANYEFELPDLETQRKLAEVLWSINDTMEAYKNLISATDELVKSQFIEMFGNSDISESVWPVATMEDVFSITSSRRILKSEWKESGNIPFIRVRDMVQLANKEPLTNEFYVTEDFYNSRPEEEKVKPGDIIVSATSTIGKTYIIKPGERFYFKDADVLLFRKKISINDVFFAYGLTMPTMWNQIEDGLGTTTVAHFLISKACKLRQPLPPIELQEQFAAFVQQSDKSKFELEQALAELNATYKRIIAENLG